MAKINLQRAFFSKSAKEQKKNNSSEWFAVPPKTKYTGRIAQFVRKKGIPVVVSLLGPRFALSDDPLRYARVCCV